MSSNHVGRVRPAESGSAVVEFALGIGVLLVPAVYAAGALVATQAAANMVTTAAHQASLAFATAADLSSARVRAHVAADLAAADQGLRLPAGALQLACLGGPCLAAGSSVRATVSCSVRVPLLGELPFRVRSSHVTPVLGAGGGQ